MSIESRVVILVPVYEDAESFGRLVEDLKREMTEDFYLLAVDDGSLHHPLSRESLRDTGVNGEVLCLRMNLGHQKAIAVGLEYLSRHLENAESKIVIMDSDGEDRPAKVGILLEELENPLIDVVAASRKKRHETMRFKIFYRLYTLIFRVLTGRKINFGNFMALNFRSLSRLVLMPELWTQLAGCVLLSKLRLKIIPVSRGKRYAGKSKMNFSALVLHGFRALMIFIEDILVRIGVFCVLTLLLSALIGGLVLAVKILGYASPGWLSTVFGTLLVAFLQIGSLALMTLLLTGIMKGGSYRSFPYERIVHSTANDKPAPPTLPNQATDLVDHQVSRS